MKSEAKVQTEIMKYLEDNGCYVIKIVRANKQGVSDLAVCLKSGKFMCVEVKCGNNKPTKMQMYHLNLVETSGGLALWANSLEMLKAKLERLEEPFNAMY